MVKKKNTKEVAGPDKEIFAVFQKETKKTFNYKQIAKRLGMNKATSRQEIIMAMARLTKDGRLVQDSPGRFKLSEREAIQLKKHSFIVGKLEMANTGKGFVIPEDGGEDIRISPANLGKALDGDKVKVYLFAKRSGKQSEGEIIDVVERAKPLHVGIIRVSERFAFLMPESKTGTDIFIPLNALKGARDGEKAVARIVDWPDGSKSPVGEITEVLGFPGKTEVEVSAIMIDHNLPIAFPDEVEAEAKKIITTIDEAEIGRRRDFRNITTFTIDPIDAKDFDDALSIREIKKGIWEIGIHIADVSHYVKPGSILDNEAYARATSVYLVDRCVPMLPEILSNGVCSLRPNEEKLCYSAVFEMDESGKVLKEWFGRTVILSKRRFNYDEAQDIVDSGKGDLATELTFLDSMAKKLRAERFKKGSINFERSEVKFRLDAQGNPTGVFLKENKDSNKLIEEFMLLANRKVAEYCSRKSENSPNRPFVYRTHDDPDPERISEFSRFLKKLGYTLRTGSRKGITESINQLLVEVHGKNEQNIIETLAVRTMAKAKYTTNNIGHYGLGFDYYTHFTSPIRRYPDVMVHRLLDKQLKNAKAESQDAMEASCKHSSEMEVRAEKAERESVKFMQARFLSNSIGLIFEGIISGVTKWGIFVELTENHCEGMVRLKDIDDDFYYFDEENYRVVGQRTKNEYRLGDKVFVRIARADAAQRQIDMVLVKGK